MSQNGGDRKFHEEFPKFSSNVSFEVESRKEISKFIRSDLICRNETFIGPFGRRQVLYCDYTASGRPLNFIENYIRENVLPLYGNTHTTSTVTSLQTTMFRDEARQIIRSNVGATENDVVIFTGNGCTGAVNKLIHSLNLKTPPIVFVSPYEHHSNLLPWKEIGSKIIWITETMNGEIDIENLIENLESNQKMERPLIGCFSAASNVTGILVDVDRISSCLHKYGALAFFDYATAGPYTEINMNPLSNSDSNLTYKDAIFISPHKFVGGPETPGILVAKKSCFYNEVPSEGGGGSVFFVTENHHRYLKNIEMREEGGTPAIIGSIRAGLIFQLKQKISHEYIMKRDEELVRLATERWSKHPQLILLGKPTLKKLPIFSFVIKHHGSGRFLHHNFISTLLNDLFGIQSRGGCACAGPYAQNLLGMSESVALEYEKFLLEDQRLDRHHLRRQREYSDKEILRPGFTRLNLPYFYEDEEIEFIINAVLFVAEKGWKFLPQYKFNPETGEWKERNYQIYKERKWLGSIRFTNGNMAFPKNEEIFQTQLSFQELLNEAENLLLKKIKSHMLPDERIFFGEDGERLRWFLTPYEAMLYLDSTNTIKDISKFILPFEPGRKIDNTKNIIAHYNEILNLHHCNCSRLFVKNNIKNTHNYMHDRLSSIENNLSKEEIRNDKQQESSNINQVVNHTEEKLLICTINKRNGVSETEKNNVAIKFHKPPKIVYHLAVEAIEEFKMIRNGDKVLLCLSGGKDSLSMLHIIKQFTYHAQKKGINFNFGAMTVDPKSSGFDPSPLKEYLKKLVVPYFYEEQDIIGQASELPVCESICSFCSRMKRGRIYACARREGYNVIALGQHLDDAAESFLMSAFHNGYLKSMKASYVVQEGDLRVIRPLINIREKDLRTFSEKVKLPVIAENCPACFESPKERHRVKQLLAQQELLFPNIFKSLRTALSPLISKDKTGMESRKL